MKKEITTVTEIKSQIGKFVGNKENLNSLLATTFKGLGQKIAEQAMLEGMIRGFELKDFMEKNVYAVPFKSGYSLITSIDYARKIGMRSGVVGKSAPVFTFDGKTVESCEVTIKRKVGDYIGEYSSLVYFDEYTTGRNLWANKPKTMIAKVAEMHALRMACPEELAQAYVEEEYERENVIDIPEEKVDAIKKVREEIAEIKTLNELRTYREQNKGKGKEIAQIILDRAGELTPEPEEINVEDTPFPEK
jgi:hypothetical protein